MRLNTLDLIRYGKFTDHTISLGEKPTSGCDFHIIYGPNEAGKSTTFSALVDLLFGIEKRSRYDFKHPYPTMRIAGDVEIDGTSTRFIRTKREQNSLLDEQENPIADATILAELGGIDRPAFQTMFSLDDESLESGGESILASKGELGELLFSASSGLAALGQQLVDVREACDRFYKPRGQSHQLSNLKRELDSLKQERDGLDTVATAYLQLVANRDQAHERYKAVSDELAQQKGRLETLKRLSRAHPKYHQLQALMVEAAPLMAIPDAPDRWSDEIRALETEGARLETERALTAEQMKKASDDLATISVDEKALGLADTIEDLKALRARFATAEEDLPDRKRKRAELQGSISAALRQLHRFDEGDPSSLLIGAATVGLFDELMPLRPGLDECLRSAQAEHALAINELEEAEARQSIVGLDGNSLSEAIRHNLAATVDAFTSSDFEARARLARADGRDEADQLQTQMTHLWPWEGEAADLSALIVPSPDELAGWKSELTALLKQFELLDSEIATHTDAHRTFAVQLGALEETTGLVTDGEARNVRDVRDTAWAEHKRRMDEASAGIFEASLKHDDQVSMTRLAHASDVARQNELRVLLATAESDLSSRLAKRLEVEAALRRPREAVVRALNITSPHLPKDWSIERFEAWLKARELALETVAAMHRTDRKTQEAQEDGNALRDRLKYALGEAAVAINVEIPDDVLVRKAKDLIAAQANQKALEIERERSKRNVQTRTSALDAAERMLSAWADRWEAACASCWFGDDGLHPTVEVVTRLLKGLDGLKIDLNASAELDHRIEAMENDQREFTERVAALADAAGMAHKETALRTDRSLCGAVEAAKANAQRRGEAEKAIAELGAAQGGLISRKAAHDLRVQAMTGHFDVETLGEVASKMVALSRRNQLLARVKEYETDILETLALETLGEAAGHLENFASGETAVEIEQINRAVEDEEGRARDLFAQHSKAVDAIDAVGGDAAVAKLEERRRNLLLHIEDGALTWLRLKLGITAAEHALRLYRDQHRSAMMTRASKAFSLLSNGAYTGLSAQPNKDAEVLVAISRDGSSKLAADLSKGARFQLYLALRVAGYQEFVTRRRPVPFIADDIMETFDDFRAEETFKLFAEMAQSGQVIYLTHHQHLCEIARKVCPGVRVHELH